MRDTDLKARAQLAAVITIRRAQKPELQGLEGAAEAKLLERWQAMSDEWDQINVAYTAAARLARFSKTLASGYAKRADELRKNAHAYAVKPSYIMALHLAIRTLRGVNAQGLATEDDRRFLISCLDRVAPVTQKATLLRNLSLAYFQSNAREQGKQVVAEHLRPLLATLRGTNPADWAHTCTIAATALYEDNATVAIDLISALPDDWRDLAYDEILIYKLRSYPLSEPYEATATTQFQVTWDAVVECCKVLALVSSDSVIYAHVYNLISRIGILKQRRQQLTREQKIDLSDRLRKIIDEKLPAKNYIQHEGFKIVALAKVMRLDPRTEASEWDPLIERGKAVTNIADKVMVLGIIACTTHSINKVRSKELFREAIGLSQRITAIVDKVDRFYLMADEALECDEKQIAEDCLRRAVESIGNRRTEELISAERRIVDLAYKISPALAPALASMLDNDPAKKETRERFEASRKLLDLKHDIESARTELDVRDAIRQADVDQMARATTQLLASLNSGRSVPISISDSVPLLKYFANIPLTSGFSGLSWITENLIRRLPCASLHWLGACTTRSQAQLRFTRHVAGEMHLWSREYRRSLRSGKLGPKFGQINARKLSRI